MERFGGDAGEATFDTDAVLKALDALDAEARGATGNEASSEAIPFLRAASVLHVFNPETLQPYGPSSPRSSSTRPGSASCSPPPSSTTSTTSCTVSPARSPRRP